jgi:RNA polymerase sigma-70 factor (ECF subfamily)
MDLTDKQKISDRITDIYNSQSRSILATLIRYLGDIDLAEEVLQEAFESAIKQWPQEGIPDNPRAWLVSTGRFKGIDVIRRQKRGKELQLDSVKDGGRTFSEPDEWDGEVIEDDQLRLIFTCCHPLLSTEGRIALALREVCGLTTEETARSFLISVEAMKRRITRAKALIRKNQIPYEIPTRADMPERLDSVLHVIYLIYNEGYSATSGDNHIRSNLTQEAIFLGREIVRLNPVPEAIGLLALLLFHESRSDSRVDEYGDLIPLESQDRSRWNGDFINEGLKYLQQSIMSGTIGPYTIQAAIASVHASSLSVDATNWNLIVTYYGMLLSIQNSPVVELQRGIAIGMRDGPEAGLRIVDVLLDNGPLVDYHSAHAARAEFARRSDRINLAVESYRRAIELVSQEPEKRYLERKLAEIV